MLYKITRPQSKEWNDKKFVEAYLVDEKNEEFKVSAWAGEFTEPDGLYRTTIDVELFKNEKGYWAISKPKKAAGANFMANKRTADIEHAMDKKSENIAKAQDRSAWMWAKNNASQLLTGSYTVGTDLKFIADKVITLATLIYNGEPTEPFSSPIRHSSEVTGTDHVNQVNAEKLFGTGLTDEELRAMDDIPF